MILHDEIVISVIMPAFNSSKYIHEAINSVLSQTYSNWELIVIDDCSTDGTVDIVREYMHDKSNIRILCLSENKGPGYCRNYGIKHAKGEYIAFLDSDDIWKATKLERQINIVEKGKYQFVCTARECFSEEKFIGKIDVPNVIDYGLIQKNNYINCSSVLIKKDLLLQFDESRNLHEDYLLWLNIMKNDILAYGIQEVLLLYRISKKSITANKLKSIIMTFKTYDEHFNSKLKSILYLFRNVIISIKKYRN